MVPQNTVINPMVAGASMFAYLIGSVAGLLADMNYMSVSTPLERDNAGHWGPSSQHTTWRLSAPTGTSGLQLVCSQAASAYWQAGHRLLWM
jgi:hypothetical protein